MMMEKMIKLFFVSVTLSVIILLDLALTGYPLFSGFLLTFGIMIVFNKYIVFKK